MMDAQQHTIMERRKMQLLHEYKATIEDLGKAYNIDKAAELRAKALVIELNKEQANQEVLVQEDPQGRPISLLAEITLFVVLGVGEGFVNYPAAQGLDQDETSTIGITVGMTVATGLLAFVVGRAYRNRRRDEIAGHVHTGWGAVESWLAAAGVFLTVTLLFREHYFAVINKLEASVLGSVAVNPWVIATGLTALAGVGIAIAAYLVSRSYRELAKSKNKVVGLTRTLEKIRKTRVLAEARIKRHEHDLHGAVAVAKSDIAQQLAGEGQLPDEQVERDEMLAQVEKALWEAIAQTAGIEPPSVGPNPPEPPAPSHVRVPRYPQSPPGLTAAEPPSDEQAA